MASILALCIVASTITISAVIATLTFFGPIVDQLWGNFGPTVSTLQIGPII
ncbi:MAG: hypothetical protein ABSA79_02635 [Candidatus Bathyarchaeia archaeon]